MRGCFYKVLYILRAIVNQVNLQSDRAHASGLKSGYLTFDIALAR